MELVVGDFIAQINSVNRNDSSVDWGRFLYIL